MARVTNEVLLQRLDGLSEFLKDHVTKDEAHQAEMHRVLDGLNGSAPGIKTRVDRLEQSEGSRKWHFRTIWAALVSIGLTLTGNWIWR
ncbi:MAG: hypothetical protein ACRD2L_25135 [Terriglobia bacterium]